MKVILTVLRFYRHNLRSTVLLFLMLLLSQFTAVCLVGTVQNQFLYRRVFRRIDGYENLVYFDTTVSGYREPEANAALLKELSAAPEITEICSAGLSAGLFSNQEGRSFIAVLLPERLFAHTPGLKTVWGGYASSGVTQSGALEAFAGAETPLSALQRGGETEITKQGRDGETRTLPVRLAGTFSASSLLPIPQNGGNGKTLPTLYSDCRETVLFLDTPEVRALLQLSESAPIYSGYLFLRDGTSPEEQDALFQPYRENGLIAENAALIQENTALDFRSDQSLLQLDLFFFSVSTLFLFAMTALLTDRQTERLSVYFLVGLDKKKGALLLAGNFAVTALAAAAINSLLVLIQQAQPAAERSPLVSSVAFGAHSYITLLLQVLLVFLVQLAEIRLLTRGKSFVSIRKAEARE